MINRYSKYKNKKFQYAVAVYIYKICLELEIDDLVSVPDRDSLISRVLLPKYKEHLKKIL